MPLHAESIRAVRALNRVGGGYPIVGPALPQVFSPIHPGVTIAIITRLRWEKSPGETP